MRFLYLYVMRDKPDLVRTTAPEHAAYWREHALPDYVGGPFADRSGGLITFSAATASEAAELVAGDPFLREDLVADHQVKEWIIDER